MAHILLENLDRAGLQYVVSKIRASVTDSLALTKADIVKLNKRLDTLVGSDDVTSVIDTFNEIETFLLGVTNTESLTGLLEEMKAEIIALIPNPRKDVIHIDGFVSGVTFENSTTSATSKTEGARIVYDNSTNRLLLAVGTFTVKYYASWGDALAFGNIMGAGVVPSKDRIYTVDADTDSGVDIALWNGATLSCLHFREIEDLQDALPIINTLLTGLRNDLNSTRSMAEDNAEEIGEIYDILNAGVNADLLDGLHANEFTRKLITSIADGKVAKIARPELTDKQSYLIGLRKSMGSGDGLVYFSTYASGSTARATVRIFALDKNKYEVYVNGASDTASLYVKNVSGTGGAAELYVLPIGAFIATPVITIVDEVPSDAVLSSTNANMMATLGSSVRGIMAQDLPSGTNLNTLKDVNFTIYNCPQGSSYPNTPGGLNGFSIQVYPISSGYVCQEVHGFKTDGSRAAYIRYTSGSAESGWTLWKKMLTEDDIADLTTRLDALESQI